MNGAQALIRTLVDAGVDVCFTNPGTSEMHFVAALDAVPEMRGVLGLFEGVATGAADGYARMADRPAATLLHLGPGLGNGLANLHNARRAHTPIVNIVGDHATLPQAVRRAARVRHRDASRATCRGWIRTLEHARGRRRATRPTRSPRRMGPPGQVATLILPADVSWSDGGDAGAPRRSPPRGAGRRRRRRRRRQGAARRRAGRAAARRRRRAASAACVAASRDRRGHRGQAARARRSRPASSAAPACPTVERLGYLAEFAVACSSPALAHLVLVDAKAPVSFFAYPDKASDLVPEGCEVHVLAAPGDDAVGALERARRRGRRADADAAARSRPAGPTRPTGALTAETVADAIGALLPEGAIVVRRGATRPACCAAGATAGAPRARLADASPAAPSARACPSPIGAAVAVPRPAGDRLAGRRQRDVHAPGAVDAWPARASTSPRSSSTTASYAILNMELQPGRRRGRRARRRTTMLDLSRPDLDFVALAAGHGRAGDARRRPPRSSPTQFERALAEPGPHLIEAMVPALV